MLRATGNISFLLGTLLIACFLIYYYRSRNRVGYRFPPGPKGLPIVGNFMDLPPGGVPEFQHWLNHKEAYGLISSVTVLGQTIVIIHDKQAAHDLLEKNSNKTSARATLEFGHRLCGFDRLLLCQQFNNTFRRQRRFMQQQFGTKAAMARYIDTFEVEVRQLLLRILREPEKFVDHFKTASGAIILSLTYGYSIEPSHADPLVNLIEHMLTGISLALVPLAWMVDIIPSLQYLPDFLPGTAFKQVARQWNKITQAVADVPYSFVRQQMANGTYRPSYVSRLVQQVNKGGTERWEVSHDDEDSIKWSAATLYAAGSGTTVSNLSSFILAMVLFPEVQRKAQDEIDRVVGNDRLPQLDDRDKLPYIEGVVKEALRWLPVACMGSPHVTEEAIIYSGHLIPKGAMLLPAIWWFCHDPSVYHNPDSFDPERYLKPHDEPDPRAVVFGFGRRICPGQHIANSSLFLAISQILAVFKISNAVDEHGRDIETKLGITAGLVCHPQAFQCSIEPKSAKSADLVLSVEVEHPWQKGDAAILESDIMSALTAGG